MNEQNRAAHPPTDAQRIAYRQAGATARMRAAAGRKEASVLLRPPEPDAQAFVDSFDHAVSGAGGGLPHPHFQIGAYYVIKRGAADRNTGGTPHHPHLHPRGTTIPNAVTVAF
jgi:hypothetical protein